MHVNNDMIKNAEFVVEEKPERTSYSSLDENGHAFFVFSKMYDESKKIKLDRKKLYDNLQEKYGPENTILRESSTATLGLNNFEIQ